MDKTFTLNERTYTFGTIPPFEAIKVEIAVAKVIGEPLFKAFTANERGEADAEAAGAAAVGLMLSKMDANELIETMKTVFTYVNVDGKRVQVESDFNGRNKELWQVFIAALRFNFSDFLPAGLLSSIAGKTPASN